MQIVSWTRASAFALLLSMCSLVQAQDANLCAIAKTPSQFCGKMITVRGTTWHGVDNGGLRNDQCRTGLGWKTPEKSGVHVRFKLKRDEAWQTFTHYDAMSTELRGGPGPWLDLNRPP